MPLNPYLNFNGQCEAAFKLYEKVLGGKIEFKMTHGESPMADKVSADWQKKIMHATLRVGDNVLMGSDAPPQYFQKPQGFSVSLASTSPKTRSASSKPCQKKDQCRCLFSRPSGRRSSACSLTSSASRG